MMWPTKAMFRSTCTGANWGGKLKHEAFTDVQVENDEVILWNVAPRGDGSAIHHLLRSLCVGL
jgi:hypothetical protein